MIPPQFAVDWLPRKAPLHRIQEIQLRPARSRRIDPMLSRVRKSGLPGFAKKLCENKRF